MARAWRSTTPWRSSPSWLKHLVYTDIARDGMQTGIDVEAYRHIAQVAGFPVVASGGISSVADIAALAEAGDDVIEGCITGRALYEAPLALSGSGLPPPKGGDAMLTKRVFPASM